jgi:predicted small lipoprotein YifL
MPGILTACCRTLLAVPLIGLAGCGLKGDLVLPDRDEPRETIESVADDDGDDDG